MNILYVIKTFSVVEPVGVLQLSAVTKQQGHHSFIAAIDDGDVEKKIQDNRIDVVAFSCLSTEAKVFLRLARYLCSQYPRLRLIVGGPHPTYFPQIADSWPVDAVIVGEGDWVIADVMRALAANNDLAGIPNIHTKNHRNDVRPLIADLDDLPFADRELVRNVVPYKDVRMKSFFATRGCPYQCAYCFNSAYMKLYKGKGSSLRRRSVENLICEIEEVKENFPMNFVRFGDDTFVLNYDEWVEEFAAEYAERIGLPFYMLINPNCVSERLIKLLKRAGCYSVMMGIETGDEHVRRNLLKRAISDKTILQAFRIFRNFDIKIFSNTILGLPDSTLLQDLQSVNFTLDCQPAYSGFTVFTPFPGTELYNYSAEQGYIEGHQVGGESFPESMQQSSCLKSISEERKRIHKNILALAPVANAWPLLRKMTVKYFIYWSPNPLFAITGFLARNYLNMKIWPFKKSPLSFLRIAKRVIAIDKKNYAARLDEQTVKARKTELKMIKNKYIITRFLIIVSLIKKRKISLRKLINTCHCFLAYAFRFKRSARSPFLINFELSNSCNANCVFCRNEKGEIHDLNPQGPGLPIPQGNMPFEIYAEVLRQVKDYLLMATLYINGEPLIYRDIYKAIRFATDNNVASMISTNGILLNATNSKKLLEAGIDFVKIALSGLTRDVYSIQVRRGNVEEVKNNIRTIVKMNQEGNYNAVILVDYISYNYSLHELPAIRKFCADLGVLLSIRPGNPKGMEDKEPSLSRGESCVKIPCDWLWKVLSINWNGDVLPCCDYVVWSRQKPYATFEKGKTQIMGLWNGPAVKNMRWTHRSNGRQSIPICEKCDRQGVAFKY